MTYEFRPFASYENRALRVALQNPEGMTRSQELEVVIDLDEFGDPSGIEVVGFCSALGSRAAGRRSDLVTGPGVRFSYDRESDAAAIGVTVGSGTRVRKSIPKRATAGLDSDGQLVTLMVTL
jgi:uncharacterized protein YuzE